MSTSYRSLLLKYLRPQWSRVVLLALLLFLTLGLELVSPVVLARFIDGALAALPAGSLLNLAALYLAMALSIQLIALAQTYVAGSIALTAMNELRADLLRHSLALDMNFHNTHTAGELIERVDGDVEILSNFFSQFAVQLLGNGLLLVGILAALWLVDPRVGALMLAVALLTILAIYFLRNVAVPPWHAAREASALLFGFLEERLTGTADIRANGAVAYTMQRFYQRSRGLLWHTLRAIFMGNTVFLASRTLFALGTAGALALAIYLFDQRLIALGTTYLIYRYTELLSRPLENISRQIQDLQQAGAGLLRVQALLATQNPMQDGPQQIPAGPLSVEFRNVTFGYAADEPILRDVSFRLQPGRVLGLLGRTGSGKTSITRLLFRLYDVNAGQVLVGGVEVQQTGRQQLRQRIGMVTQSIQLFHATVRDNLTFFDPTVPDERIIQVLQELGMGPWLAQLPQGLDTTLQAGGGGVSAGQAQLLAFARVFLHDAGLVILDEASSRLDPATERYIEKAVQRLLEDRTVIIIAHRLNTVMQADEIMVLENGRIIEHGDRAALAADPHSRFATLLRTGLDEEEPAGPADELVPLEVLDGR